MVCPISHSLNTTKLHIRNAFWEMKCSWSKKYYINVYYKVSKGEISNIIINNFIF